MDPNGIMRRNEEAHLGCPLVFLNAALSGLGDRMLNDQVLKILARFNVRVFAPQVELPLGTGLTTSEILQANVSAVKRCNVVLSVLDKPGNGVAFELGVAVALNRTIIAFRPSTGENFGKVLEGLWQSLPPEGRATTFDELDRMLQSHFQRREPSSPALSLRGR